MNGQAGGENGEVKIDSGKCSQTKRYTEEIEFSHGEIIGVSERLSRGFCASKHVIPSGPRDLTIGA
jgi:hypothetical protein